MSFRPRLHAVLVHLRSHSSTRIATGVLIVAVLLGTAGLGLLATERQERLPEQAASSRPDPSATNRTGVAATIPARIVPPTPAAVAPVDESTAGVNPDEISRQLADFPAGRWSYAFRAAEQRPPAAPVVPPPRRVVPVLPASALGFAWPLGGVVTSNFDDGHPLGIDIAPAGQDEFVLAARDGTVIAAGGDPCCGYGYFVMLDHGEGITSVYGHLRESPTFQPGEWVARGTVLGVAGDTGHSFGIHLHFEVRVNGVPVDPEAALTGGHLTPLAPPIATETPSAPDPTHGDPHGGTPPSDAVDQPDVTATAEPDASPSTAPTPPVEEEPIATPPQQTPEPHPPVAEVPATPSPTPAVVREPTPVAATPPAVSPTPSPRATASVTPPPPSATPPPSSATPTPPSAGTPSPSPSATATAERRCEIVRFPISGGFVRLESDGIGVESIVAERCDADAATTVTVKPADDHRCTVDVEHQGDRTRLRPLPATIAEGEVTPAETRWSIEPGKLRPGAVVRIACQPASAPD